MQELRFVAVSEDGSWAVLAVPGRSARFTLPIDERLRAVALGQASRLVQYEIEVESPLRPKEIQARIRAGETVEEIADAAGIAVERVRWFEGPVLAERAYIADQAQAASVRRQGDATPATPGPRLGEIVAERLQVAGSDPEDAQWDAKKRGDGSWQVQLTFIAADRSYVAEWVFDPRRRHVLPADENAARMSLPGGEPPQPAAPTPGEATVTQLAPRLSTASGQGLGQSGTGTSGFGPAGFGNGGPGSGALGSGRARHERPGSSRPAISEPPPSASSAPSVPRAAAAPVAPAAPASEPSGDVTHSPGLGRHSLPQATSQKTAQEPAFIRADPDRDDYQAAPEQQVAELRIPEAPAGPAQRTQEPRAAQARPEAAGPAARSETRAGETAAPAAASAAAPAEDSHLAPDASAEPASEQAGRQGRKSARGKRASVPSWDEIMFGSSRQQD